MKRTATMKPNIFGNAFDGQIESANEIVAIFMGKFLWSSIKPAPYDSEKCLANVERFILTILESHKYTLIKLPYLDP